MKRLMLAMLLLPSLTLGAEEKAAATSSDPMAGWVPPKVKNEAKDKQEIQALFRSMDAAAKAGDLEGAAALVDFPVTMVTDDSKGQSKSAVWDRDKWTEVMKPFYEKPRTDVKVTHKPTIFMLSDSLAAVNDVATWTHGGKTVTARSASLVVRSDGKWRIKTMAEGGWGDMMKETPATASGAQGPASEGTGSAAERPGSMGTGSSEQTRPETQPQPPAEKPMQPPAEKPMQPPTQTPTK